MFARLFAIASLAALAVAGPARLTARSGTECNTGSLSCCNSVQGVSEVNHVLALFGLDGVVASATDSIGINCHPITNIGTGSGAVCQQAPVCCTDDKMYGLFNVACIPANTNA